LSYSAALYARHSKTKLCCYTVAPLVLIVTILLSHNPLLHLRRSLSSFLVLWQSAVRQHPFQLIFSARLTTAATPAPDASTGHPISAVSLISTPMTAGLPAHHRYLCHFSPRWMSRIAPISKSLSLQMPGVSAPASKTTRTGLRCPPKAVFISCPN
jgi:hypothetical protein